jgi:hypothetical protein
MEEIREDQASRGIEERKNEIIFPPSLRGFVLVVI